jgi:hypothetical protein
MDRLTSITFQIKKGFLLSSFLFEAKQHSLNILSGEFLCCKEQTVFKSLCYILSSDDNRQRHFKWRKLIYIFKGNLILQELFIDRQNVLFHEVYLIGQMLTYRKLDCSINFLHKAGWDTSLDNTVSVVCCVCKEKQENLNKTEDASFVCEKHCQYHISDG